MELLGERTQSTKGFNREVFENPLVFSHPLIFEILHLPLAQHFL